MSPLTTVLTQSTQHYAAAQRSRNYMTCSPKLRRRSARKSPELTPGRGRENRMAITGRVTFPAATAGALTVFLLRRFLGVLRMPALIHSNGSAFLADRGNRRLLPSTRAIPPKDPVARSIMAEGFPLFTPYQKRPHARLKCPPAWPPSGRGHSDGYTPGNCI